MNKKKEFIINLLIISILPIGLLGAYLHNDLITNLFIFISWGAVVLAIIPLFAEDFNEIAKKNINENKNASSKPLKLLKRLYVFAYVLFCVVSGYFILATLIIVSIVVYKLRFKYLEEDIEQ